MAKPKRLATSVDDKARVIAERWIASEHLGGAERLAKAVLKYIRASKARVKEKHNIKRIVR